MNIATFAAICTLAIAAYGCSGGSGNGTVGSPGNSTQNGTATSGSAAAVSGSATASGSASVSGSVAAATGNASGNGSLSGSMVATGGAGTTADSGDVEDGGASDSGSNTGSNATDSGEANGIAVGATAPLDNAETDYTQTKTLTMGTFTVPPNQEVFYCQTFANPWGKQTDIKTYDLAMNTGSHHLIALYSPGASNGSLVPCAAGGLTYGAFSFVSVTPTSIITFPGTVGASLPANYGFNLTVHYVNTSATTLTAHVSLTMYAAKDGVITNHAGVIFMNNAGMTVPPTGTPVVSSVTMKLNQPVNIMLSLAHMHKFATNYSYTATPPGGQEQTIYTTTQWDEPKPALFAQPLSFPSGTNYTWSCTDVNNTGKTLTFGEHAQTNVMCIAISIFYPAMNVDNPVIGSPIAGF